MFWFQTYFKRLVLQADDSLLKLPAMPRGAPAERWPPRF